MEDLRPFFEEVHYVEHKGKNSFTPYQWGANLICATMDGFDWDAADIIIVGCGECRGGGRKFTHAANAVRDELYHMFLWHSNVKIADLGNLKEGASLRDTHFALQAVLQEIHKAGKIAVVIGGSHDLTMLQYDTFRQAGQTIVATVADMLIDLEEENENNDITDTNFLMEMLSGTPNFISHYNHLAFQSYYADPHMVETLDKLRFDFYRLGKIKENMEDMEPVLRSSNLFSFDMSAVRYSDAPANIKGSPNGLNGEEACQLTRYAGMSNALTSFGIYGFDERRDVHGMTAKLIAQMIWYFVDGIQIRKSEASLTEKEEFIVFNITFTDNDTIFIKSKRTNRWWMKLPDQTFVPCSYQDFITASNDGIPERWLREQERVV